MVQPENEIQWRWFASQQSQPGRTLRPVTLAVHAHLHERFANRDAPARKKWRFHRADQVGLLQRGEPRFFLLLGLPISRRNEIERIGNPGLVFDREGKSLAHVHPESVRHEHVMHERPELRIARGNLVSPDRVQQRSIGVRLVLEELLKQGQHLSCPSRSRDTDVQNTA